MHRLIFLLHHKYLPSQIDHIDGNILNNRIENLRAATPSQNGSNKPKTRFNTSGFKGVVPVKNGYGAKIMKNKKAYWLGTFAEPEVAHAAYVAASKKLHGEFSHE